MNFRRFISLWTPVFGWAGFIFYLSGIPGLKTEWGVWDIVLRKCAHMGEFAILTVLLFRAVQGSWPMAVQSFQMKVSGIGAFLYAISDEIHQSFVPNRGPSVKDVLIDAIGIMLGLIIVSRILKRKGFFQKIIQFSLVGFTIVFFAGCGPDRQFQKIEKLEQKGEVQLAWEKYQEFAARYPKHTQAAAALYKAGWLAQNRLGDCTMARAFYQSVLQRYPQSEPWARQAAYYENNCPDYFPLLKGTKWVEGDSETQGKNARVEIICRSLPSKKESDSSFSGILEKTYFAGTSKFKTVELIYKKTESELQEYVSMDDPRSKTILMWPLQVGTKWSTKSANKLFRYEIVASNKKIKVQAGEFSDCLHVRSTIDGFPGATNEYYAPDVGRVLVSISSSEGEKRNIELLSFVPAGKTGAQPTP